MSDTNDSQNQNTPFISIEDAARYLSVSEKLVARWIKLKKLRAFRLNNTMRISRDEFFEFIKTNTTSVKDGK